MHGYICPECGCYLDPGERCDCREEKAKEEEKRKSIFERSFSIEDNGQICMAL